MKNGKIELLRFCAAMSVLMIHINSHVYNLKRTFLNGTFSMFAGGAIAVEFFFVLSGLFMARSIARRADRPAVPSLADETLGFLYGKVKGLIPYHIVLCTLAAVVMFIKFPFDQFVYRFALRLPSLLFLQSTGLSASIVGFVAAEWYISSMLIAMAIIYPISRKYYNMYTHLAGPVAAVLLLGWLCMKEGRISNEGLYRNLRAFTEITLGMTCYEISTRLTAKNWKPSHRAAFTAAEVLIWLSVLVYIITVPQKSLSAVILLLICAGITITFSNISYGSDSKLFQNKLVFLLGKISLPLYLCHDLFTENVPIYFRSAAPKYQSLIIIVASFAMTFALYLPISAWQRRKAQQRK